MIENMRRLHPRGAANRGICVDTEGAMLGPHHVLVSRTSPGYGVIDRDCAATLQKGTLVRDRDPDWLFRQCQRIADALNRGEIALAQIYGLHFPLDGLDRLQVDFAKAGFNPDEPRIPKGEPHAGEWTTGGASEGDGADEGGGNEGEDGGSSGGGTSATTVSVDSSNTDAAARETLSPESSPIKWELRPLAGTEVSPSPEVSAHRTAPSTDPNNPAFAPPGVDAINADYSIDNFLISLVTGGIGGASRALARALIRLGISRGAGAETHHIVAARRHGRPIA